MWQRRTIRLAIALSIGLLLTAALVALAGAYAEEPITFRDPTTDQTSDVEVSTIHTDLTYVLALAAGFSITDSRTLMIWDQLVDANVITTTNTSYSNCSGTFPPPIVRCQGNTDSLFWPAWGQVASTGDGRSCVTSRYGPFEGFFHFPHRNGPEMAALKAWGWGAGQQLVGYQGYVWGPNLSEVTSFFGHTCMLTEPVTIDTGMPPGSLEAFATYIHSLADSYSHERCQEKTDALGWAWPTHTYPYPPSTDAERIYECNYAPTGHLQNIGDSHHGREFGTEWPEDSDRTDAAVRAVYAELAARSSQREGVYQPLSLDTPLQGITHSLTLSETLSHFVHDWNFDQPAERRKYADQMAAAILAQRTPRAAGAPAQPEPSPQALPATGGRIPRPTGILLAGLALVAAGLLLLQVQRTF